MKPFSQLIHTLLNGPETKPDSAVMDELCAALLIDPLAESVLRTAQRRVYPVPVVGYLSPAEIVYYRSINEIYPEAQQPYVDEITRLIRGRRSGQLPMPDADAAND